MAFQLPNKQWAQVLYDHTGVVQYEQIPVPKPGSDEVLVNIKYTGVCHTDLHAAKGDWPLETKLPLVGGHEGAGVVVARGELVQDVELGDHVGVKWMNGTCLQCSYCQQADEPLCAKALLSGYTVNGSFQQYCIAKAAHVARIPRNVPLDGVAPVMCAGVTVYKGLKESYARPGQTVAIVGAGGGLGCLACQYAKAMGLDVIAIDSGAEKAHTTKKLGARTFIDFKTSSDVVRDVQAATDDGLGPHAVLMVADSERSFEQAIKYIRPRGVIVIICLPPNAQFRVPVWDAVTKMITVKGSYVGGRRDTAEALEFYTRGLIDIPFKTVQLSELQHVYELMSKEKVVGRYVLDMSGEAV